MGRFAQALLNGGELEGHRIFKYETLAMMWTRQFAAADALPSFFFSCRRRHTNLQGDWSSDVCSSDLMDSDGYDVNAKAGSDATNEQMYPMLQRSEERRVGKECRSRWTRDD